MRPNQCFAVIVAIALSACRPHADDQSASTDHGSASGSAVATSQRPDNGEPFIATFEAGRETPSSQVFGALEVEDRCLVFRSRDENRTFLALLPPGTMLKGTEVRLGDGRGVAFLGSPVMFDGGPRQNPGARVASCSGVHMVLAGVRADAP